MIRASGNQMTPTTCANEKRELQKNGNFIAFPFHFHDENDSISKELISQNGLSNANVDVNNISSAMTSILPYIKCD